ncbi:hypothetical protein [Streptomyces phytohabitans]|uniref:hypothetical protein n=1 Tax=Streptomyces phytohabitans TaxID=1150371 RepID=UPI00345C1D52
MFSRGSAVRGGGVAAGAAVVAAGLVLALGGCGGGPYGDGDRAGRTGDGAEAVRAADRRAADAVPEGPVPERPGRGKPERPEAPDGSPPRAADGVDTAACADGACEILVTSTADVTANGLTVAVAVGDDLVTFQAGGSVMQLGGGGGEVGFGDELEVTVVAHDERGAVLRFRVP